MRKKYCICMVAIGENHQRLFQTNKKAWKDYADKIDADFIVISMSDGILPYHPAWAKMSAIYDLLAIYERVFYVDGDTIIDSAATPNIFEEVPEDCFGAFFEGFHAERFHCSMQPALHTYGIKTDRKYDGDYFNSGVMCVSRIHRDIFLLPDILACNFYEQGCLNARVFGYGVKVYHLSHHWNRMNLVDHICGEEWHKSYIVHWAGSNDYDAIIEQMKDVEKRFVNKATAKTRLYCCVGGGLGDAATCEPIFRYAIERVYKNDPNVEFHIFTFPDYAAVLVGLRKYPNVIFHDDVLPHDAEDHQEFFGNLKVTTPHRVCYTHPHDSHMIQQFFPYPDVHNQDYGSLCMLMQSISPRWERQPRIPVDKKDKDELIDISRSTNTFGLTDASKLCVIHAGIGWKTKTFPIAYWQAIIERLSETAVIVLMGKGKVLNVKLPENGNGIDLRNKLETRHVLALLQMADLVISNDSSPIHMAAAYDNQIMMIATCKRPELVMPYRKGAQDYRALAVYHRLTCEALEHRPTAMKFMNIADLEGDIRDYLPSVGFVCENAEMMLTSRPVYIDQRKGLEEHRAERGYTEEAGSDPFQIFGGSPQVPLQADKR